MVNENKDMDDFEEVEALEDPKKSKETPTRSGDSEMILNANPETLQKLSKTSKKLKKVEEGTLVQPYYVSVKPEVRALLRREGPGKNYKSMGVVSMGRPSATSDSAMKIISEQKDQNGQFWGELYSGGWVNLSFCVKIQ